MPNRVDVIGLKEANAALRRLPQHAKAQAQQVMDVSAFQVAQGARARVRRRTGQLAGDIHWQRRPRSLSAVVGVFRRSFYWKYLEYGTARMPAFPAFRPAAEAVGRDHETRLVRALTAAANEVERDAAAASGLGRVI